MLHLAQSYGAWLVAALIAIESCGIPVPGETTLIASAIYAATAPRLSLWIVLAAAIVGAIVGNLAGFAIGHFFGYRLLIRYGSYVRLPEPRLKIGEYLFRHYGIAVVVLARFVPLLRSIAPLVAGANRMPTRSFLAATVAGAIPWVMFDGLAAFYFGKQLIRLSTVAMIVVVLLAAAAIGGVALFIGRHEKQLQIKAEQEFPDALPRR
jgi:membrane protein DedA with SNARE-associated domain